MGLFNIFIKKICKEEEIYVRGLKREIENLISIAHEKGIKIVNLERTLRIRKDAIYEWKRYGSIPFPHFNQFNQLFSKLVGCSIDKNNLLLGLRFSHKNIKIPELNTELCYLVGYLYGDGTLSSHKETPRVEIYDSSRIFLQKIALSFKRLFNIDAYTLRKDRRGRSCYCLRFNSKILLLFFNKIFEMPIGKKKGKLHIPKVIKNTKFVRDFIAGLFDSDGHVYHTIEYGYRVTLAQSDKKILEEVAKILILYGIRSKITNYRPYSYELKISNKYNFERFISIFRLKHPDKTSRIKLALKRKSTVLKPRKISKSMNSFS